MNSFDWHEAGLTVGQLSTRTDELDRLLGELGRTWQLIACGGAAPEIRGAP